MPGRRTRVAHSLVWRASAVQLWHRLHRLWPAIFSSAPALATNLMRRLLHKRQQYRMPGRRSGVAHSHVRLASAVRLWHRLHRLWTSVLSSAPALTISTPIALVSPVASLASFISTAAAAAVSSTPFAATALTPAETAATISTSALATTIAAATVTTSVAAAAIASTAVSAPTIIPSPLAPSSRTSPPLSTPLAAAPLLPARLASDQRPEYSLRDGNGLAAWPHDRR